MHIPTPQQLGLADVFDHWRPGQEEAIRRLLLSQKRVKAFAAPTGFGKSAVYVAYGLITKKPTCIVTDSRGLQDQLLNIYQPVGMVDLRGRRNYECGLRPDMTCEEGYASRCPHKGTVGCPSSQAEMRAATSSLVVTNYDKWTASRKFGMGMSHFQQVIFDEGHKAPDALARAMQVVLGAREIADSELEFLPPSEALEVVNWKPWASRARAIVEEQLKRAKQLLMTASQPKPAWVKEVTHLRYLVKRLAILSTCQPDNWVVDEVEKGYQFDPVRPGRYAESMLLMNIPSVVVVSATLRPKSLYMLGISKAGHDFQEYPSDFDPKRCPVYYIPTMRVDKNASSLAPLWVCLDQIAGRRQDRKGIVHTISYARRDDILQASRFAPKMLVNERGEAASWIVDEFKRSAPGTIFVSPSVGEGYDFAGKACEWQFVCKIPFPDSRSKIIKARQEDDKEYGPYLAATKLEQIFGRGMRSAQDQCEGMMGDDHMDWFYKRYRHLFSQTFHNRYRRVTTVPPPPAKL